jgi:hypothetical protein
MSSLANTLRRWPRRRWVIVALAASAVAGLLAFAGPGHAWWGWPSALLTTALAPLILASYLPMPGSGRLIDVGCSPCAALAGGAALFAVLVLVGAPDDPIMAVIAALALVAAVRQRLVDATACAAARRLPPD